jgi:hypothetical protein
MDGRLLGEVARALDAPLAGRAELFTADQPMNTLVDSADVAAAALWLADDAAPPRHRHHPDRRRRLHGQVTAMTTTPAAAPARPATERQFWFAERIAPRSPAWRVLSAVRVDGTVERELLAEAAHRVTARHPALHSVFTPVGGRGEVCPRRAAHPAPPEPAARQRLRHRRRAPGLHRPP